jgi:hypothetical protein
MLVIVIVVIIVFLITINYNKKNYYCLSSCCKKEGLNTVNKGCPLLKSVFKPAITYFGSIDQNSFRHESNAKSLTNICNIGKKVVNECSKYNIFNDPLKNKDFIKLCCNNNSETCNSNIGIDCIIDKGKLSDLSYSFTNFNENSAEANADSLRNYCSLGKKIIDNGCAIDLSHPQKDLIYQKYCCENGIGTCGPGIVDKCIINKSKFMNKSPTFASWTDQTASLNFDTLQNFCDIGKKLTDGNCKGITPTNDVYYKKYCCTNGDTSQCGPDMMNKCISKKAQFTSLSSQFQTWDDNVVLANIGSVKSFCDIGQDLIDNNCTGNINPMNDVLYRKYCCNSSNDVSQCGTYNVDDCISNRIKFNNLNNTISSMSQSSIGTNINIITEFCELADKLTLKTCYGTDPTTLRNYVMNCM